MNPAEKRQQAIEQQLLAEVRAALPQYQWCTYRYTVRGTRPGCVQEVHVHRAFTGVKNGYHVTVSWELESSSDEVPLYTATLVGRGLAATIEEAHALAQAEYRKAVAGIYKAIDEQAALHESEV